MASVGFGWFWLCGSPVLPVSSFAGFAGFGGSFPPRVHIFVYIVLYFVFKLYLFFIYNIIILYYLYIFIIKGGTPVGLPLGPRWTPVGLPSVRFTQEARSPRRVGRYRPYRPYRAGGGLG